MKILDLKVLETNIAGIFSLLTDFLEKLNAMFPVVAVERDARWDMGQHQEV